MADKSLIAWCDATWNPVVGCTHAGSPACDHCYARDLHQKRHKAKLAGAKLPGQYLAPFEQVLFYPERLEQPIRWRKPRHVFVGSTTDLFHPDVPFEWVDQVVAIMAATPRHTYQVLTKRPERMASYAARVQLSNPHDPVNIACFDLANALNGGFAAWPLPNVWCGVTIANQQDADENIPRLLCMSAARRFVSVEPLLGPVTLGCAIPDNAWLNYLHPQDINGWRMPGLDWVIVGGESGTDARPMHPDWARSLRDQCVEAGVPFFFKQWGEWTERQPGNPVGCGKTCWLTRDGRDVGNLPIDQHPAGTAWMDRAGKRTAGELLDGRLWREFPSIPSKGDNDA